MLRSFHPAIAGWFAGKFGEPTDVQLRAWREIADGASTLVAAPTGSGKTLAALLPLLSRAAERKLADGEAYRRGVRTLYITPLKALNNDIHQHVFGFLDELEQWASERGIAWPGLDVGVRTGDTAQSTRASMLRKPPEVLVTTPESLYIMLTSVKARDMLSRVEHVIIDEIHNLAADDRGMHLSLSLERLVSLCGRNPQRIGVSATQKPPERIARFLGGWDDSGAERPVSLVDSDMRRAIELAVTMPEFAAPLGKKEDIWQPLIRELLLHIGEARTTLIFVNNRRLCERLTARLNEVMGDPFSRSHHGSVARERRLETERMLQRGELRCLVATSSLELGIDVGFVELVLQIDSPLSVAAGIQRIGRGGHSVGGTSRGAIIARFRGALPEIAVLSERIIRRDIEEIVVPRYGVGPLMQQLTAMVATDDYTVDELHALIQRSDSYRGFSRERLTGLLELLSGFYPFVRPLIDWDRAADRLSSRPNTRMAAVMGAGAIPQSTGYPVYHAETNIHIGELDEEFVFESRVGDVFQLGTAAWRIHAIRADRIEARETNAGIGEIPFWRADGIGRSYALGMEIGSFVAELERLLPEGDGTPSAQTEAAGLLAARSRFSPAAADSLIGLLKAQRAVSALPTNRRMVMEWFQDETGLYHVVMHNWFGRTFNRTWLLALREHLERVLPQPISFESNVKDNGFELIFRQWDPAWLQHVQGVRASNIERLLLESLPTSPLFMATFRRMAEISLLFNRSFKRTPAWLKRLRSQELLQDALPLAAQFPLVRESLRECMEQSLDAGRVKQTLEQLECGEIETVIVKSVAPSPLALQFFYEFLNQAIYESDALTRELHGRMAGLSRELAEEVFGPGALTDTIDSGALADMRARLEDGADIMLRGPDDVYRLLKERGDMSQARWSKLTAHIAGAADWLEQAIGRGAAACADIGGELRYVCADEAGMYAELGRSAEADAFIVGRYVQTVVAFTAEQLAAAYSLGVAQAEALLERWRAERRIVPAPLAGGGRLWMSARLAERLVRVSLQRYRGTQASLERYCGWLLRRQHVADATKLRGPEGVRAALEQLQGVFLPLSWWESAVLPARIAGYRQEDLDLLCSSGDICWLGRKEDGAKEGKVAFFMQEAAELYAPFLPQAAPAEPPQRQEPPPPHEPAHPDVYAALRRLGASFLTALSRELNTPPTELMPKLLDLVWQGLIANDQFAPLRLHGSGRRSADNSKFRSGLGRWYALQSATPGHAAEEKSVLAWTRHLLRMTGIVAKPHAAECSPYGWDTISTAMARLEEWGAAMRGFHVGGINWLQFADKATADELRQPLPQQRNEEITVLSAVDPANPYGTAAAWPQRAGASFAKKPGNYMVFRGGRWLLWVENRGRKLTVVDPEPPPIDELSACVRQLAHRLIREYGLRKLAIESWNGEPAAQSPLAEALAALGAERDRGAYVFWPSSL